MFFDNDGDDDDVVDDFWDLVDLRLDYTTPICLLTAVAKFDVIAVHNRKLQHDTELQMWWWLKQRVQCEACSKLQVCKPITPLSFIGTAYD